MSNFFKKFTMFLCLTSILASSLYISAENNYPDGHITVETVSAVKGEAFLVDLIMENNPGIMAITVSITYDSSALSLENNYFGIFMDNIAVDLPEKNCVRYVSCEKNNNYLNGRMLCLEFRVKETAELGFYPITVDYNRGDFSNYNLEPLIPTITAGGIEVIATENRCEHFNIEVRNAVESTCYKKGYSGDKYCLNCNRLISIGKIIKTPTHRYSETVIPATYTEPKKIIFSPKRAEHHLVSLVYLFYAPSRSFL